MEFFIYNGKIYKAGTAVLGPANRGLRYGDGVFETMKFGNDGIILADEHFARLWKGMQLLQFDIPKLWTVADLSEQVKQLAKKNKLNTARIRFTGIRGDGGIYDAINNIPNFIIEAMPLPENAGAFNINGLRLCIFRDAVKAPDAFSNIKHNNMLPYFMGGRFAKSVQCNDAVILNSRGNVCETTIANIFIIKNGIVFTPALTEGCIAGVMRNWLIKKIQDLGFTVNETALTTEDLFNADEIFLSNSIMNIRWVASVEDRLFTSALTQHISFELALQYKEIIG